LTALACFQLLKKVLTENTVPEGVFNLMIGDGSLGVLMARDRRIALVSATGSTRMGRAVGGLVMERFGKTLLELGGNNAIIVTPSADLKLAIPAIVFGAVGTAGQRCTTTRRLLVFRDIYPKVKSALIKAYESLRIGNPLVEANHLGPLIDQEAVKAMQNAIKCAKDEGGSILVGAETSLVLRGPGFESGCYVRPTLIEMKSMSEVVRQETFAPILYMIVVDSLSEAIMMNNDVPQGLSSSLFTTDLREAEQFLGPAGSDCGIANINIGTSGAEIGGAFGGEKETGGGRESGSDAWKSYMRRQTNTLNYGESLPLAQGIRFEC
jgi:aldehyde dehydrogenase (NAD+)